MLLACIHTTPHHTTPRSAQKARRKKMPSAQSAEEKKNIESHTREHTSERLICGKYLNGLLSERNSNGDAVYKWMDALVGRWLPALKYGALVWGFFFLIFSCGKNAVGLFFGACVCVSVQANLGSQMKTIFFLSSSLPLFIFCAMHRSIDSHGAYANGSKASVCRTICFVACRR